MKNKSNFVPKQNEIVSPIKSMFVNKSPKRSIKRDNLTDYENEVEKIILEEMPLDNNRLKIRSTSIKKSSIGKFSLGKDSELNKRESVKKLSVKQQYNSKGKLVSSKDVNCLFLNCKFCNLNISKVKYFKHLETECLEFIQPHKKVNNKKSLCKLIFNSVSTPFTDFPDPAYESREMQDHINLSMVANPKNHKPIKSLSLVKDIFTPHLITGDVHLKFNQFCAFAVYSKGKSNRYFVAYRMADFKIGITDIQSNEVAAVLKGHTDHITEIRHYKLIKEINILLSSSYDNTLLFWDLSTFKLSCVIKSNSWILSSCITVLDDQEKVYFVGGFSKNSPIKFCEINLFYQIKNNTSITSTNSDRSSSNRRNNEPSLVCSLGKCGEIQLLDDTIPVIIEKYQKFKKNFLYVGTDNDNPYLFIIDLVTKQIIKSIKLTNVISSMTCFYSSNAIYLYTIDYFGTISEYDILKTKLNIEFNVGLNGTDVTLLDDYYMISSGDKNNLKLIVRHKHRTSKVFDKTSDKIILNVQKLSTNIGQTILTLSADKKIKLFKI